MHDLAIQTRVRVRGRPLVTQEVSEEARRKERGHACESIGFGVQHRAPRDEGTPRRRELRLSGNEHS